MRMGQGVRTGLGHGGITCVLQTQFSSFFLIGKYLSGELYCTQTGFVFGMDPGVNTVSVCILTLLHSEWPNLYGVWRSECNRV